MGDFLHNFVDGIFIANAFLDCSQSKGWSIAAATIAHEIAQETSDFFLLITQGACRCRETRGLRCLPMQL